MKGLNDKLSLRCRVETQFQRITPRSYAWAGTAFLQASFMNTRGQRNLLAYRFNKMLIVVANRVHIFAGLMSPISEAETLWQNDSWVTVRQ